MSKDEITKAIGAHGMWKTRLNRAIESGQVDPAPATARLDDQCDFGKWLKGSAATLGKDAHYAKVKDLHARFHVEAGRVLELVQAGKPDDARAAIHRGSAFDKLSTELTMTLIDWSKAA